MKRTIRNIVRRTLGNTPIDACDEYINWLLVTNAGMQNKGNVWCFNYAIEHLPGGAPLLEIGAYCGLSANIMRYLLRKHGKKNEIISVDPFIIRGWHDEQRSNDSAYMQLVGENPLLTRKALAHFVKDSYTRNVNFFSADQPPFAFEAASDDFFNWWKEKKTVSDIQSRAFQLGGPLSFAYIDGNHDEDFARRDFEFVRENLLPGGCIFFDNSEDGSPFGSAKVAKQLEKDKRYRLITRNPNRLFQKKS